MNNQKIVMYRGKNFVAAFNDSEEASNIMNIDQNSIDEACSSDSKVVGGYQWDYERRDSKRKGHHHS